MEQVQVEQIIEQARLDCRQRLDLNVDRLTMLPSSIGRLTDLTHLIISGAELTSLPDNLGNLTNLRYLVLKDTQIGTLPESITKLTQLIHLSLENNQINTLPEDIDSLVDLTHLELTNNKLADLPMTITNLNNLTYLNLSRNKFTILPESFCGLSNLTYLNLRSNELTDLSEIICSLVSLNYLILDNNRLTDLSILQQLLNLKTVQYLFVDLPLRYWTNLAEWKSQWLLDEQNSVIRQILIERLGYEQICQELNAIDIDSWREYTLLKIEGIEPTYALGWTLKRESMMLLKMICPSTTHIHILRVPPEMVSAEDAITWVNHGIHPDRFSIQT